MNLYRIKQALPLSPQSPQQVLGLLQRDLLAADFLTTIFWAAMSSFRHDTVLRPFPPSFLQGTDQKDIEELVSWQWGGGREGWSALRIMYSRFQFCLKIHSVCIHACTSQTASFEALSLSETLRFTGRLSDA